MTGKSRLEIVICGKGGIGKTTIVSNLAYLGVKKGLEVLQIGCDPKHDSCTVHAGRRLKTVMDVFKAKGRVSRGDIEALLTKGRTGVWCLEVGGPEPGVGCAGRAITLALDLLKTAGDLLQPFDAVLYDLIGDVVCGGFAAPMRRGPETAIFMVTSGEILPIYAANNIAHGLSNLAGRGGGRLAGIIANLRNVPGEEELIARFASGIGTRVVAKIPRDPAVNMAEEARRLVVEAEPGSEASKALQELAITVFDSSRWSLHIPRPLDDDEFEALFARSGR